MQFNKNTHTHNTHKKPQISYRRDVENGGTLGQKEKKRNVDEKVTVPSVDIETVNIEYKGSKEACFITGTLSHTEYME